jgi:Type IV secretion system pilin
MLALLLAAPLHGAALASIVTALAHAGASPSGGGAPTDIFSALDKLKAAGDLLFGHFLPIGTTLCALYFAWGGLHAIAAGGSPIMMATAKRIWWHAALGFAGVLLATPFVTTIHNLFI